jgi:isoleucyl-tRNA synthetase
MVAFDRWALEKFRRFGRKLLRAYDDYEYHTVFHSLYNFFTVQLSAYYLDVLKDRLYCSAEKSTLRRSAQTVLFEILRSTLILVAPILPFTTEEAWEVMPDHQGKKESVHLNLFPDLDKERMESAEFKEWEDLGLMRDRVLKEMEVAREAKAIGNSLEAAVKLKVPPAQFDLLTKHAGDLAALFIVSHVDVELKKEDEIEIFVSKAAGGKCERCWNISTSVGQDADHPEFCKRCEAVLEEMGL